MLDHVKGYLRIDGDEDNATLIPLITAAQIYLKNATGIKCNEKNDLHKLAVSLLVSHWFENREPVGKADKLAFSLESIFYQISYCGDES